MAHNIMNRNGMDHMFVVGDRQAAWHELGQRAQECVNWADAMRLAGLEWTVEKRQLYSMVPGMVRAGDMGLNAVYAPVEHFGVFRTDDNAFLGAVGNKYTPIQNRDQFAFVDTLLEATNGAHYDSAGALGNGERVWCSARVPFDFEVVSGDVHQTYLLFTTSHDGQTSAICKLSTVQVVCQNTLNAAMSESNSFVRIRHTKTAGERLGRAAELMRGVGANVIALQAKLQALAQVEAREEFIAKVMDRLFPTVPGKDASSRKVNIVGDIMALVHGGTNATVTPQVKGSAYGLLCAITEYADFYRSVKGGNGQPEGVKAARAESALFGTGDALKSDALEVIGELVGV